MHEHAIAAALLVAGRVMLSRFQFVLLVAYGVALIAGISFEAFALS
jgi:hypothetical protein